MGTPQLPGWTVRPPAWTVRTVGRTGSTNADLLAADPADGTVLVADAQTAGRGRLGRSWSAPPGTAVLFSVALRVPQVAPARRGWIGALLGVAMVEALHETGVAAGLKWPNDVLVDGPAARDEAQAGELGIRDAKVAGILAESSGDLLVVGAGLNVTVDRADLPRADTTSLHLVGGPIDREQLLAAILDNLAGPVGQWRAAAGEVVGTDLEPRYLDRLRTVGRRVRVELPGGGVRCGAAVGVDPAGALLVTDDDGVTVAHAAADVVHLRAAVAPGGAP